MIEWKMVISFYGAAKAYQSSADVYDQYVYKYKTMSNVIKKGGWKTISTQENNIFCRNLFSIFNLIFENNSNHIAHIALYLTNSNPF